MPLSDMSGTIARLSTGIYTITRYTGSAMVNGRYLLGTAATFTIKASVQIAQGRDLLILPEGLRTKEVVVIFTSAFLTTAKTPGSQNDADQLTYLGTQWEIITSEDRSGPGNYFRCLAKKMGQ